MLADAGASHVIVGHSERRADHGETDAQVRAKAEAVLAGGLTAIVCIGETLAEREAGRTLEVVGASLPDRCPTARRAPRSSSPTSRSGPSAPARSPRRRDRRGPRLHPRRTCRALRGRTGGAFRLLYGGSVKAANAAEIFAVPDVDGALVGGASLKAATSRPSSPRSRRRLADLTARRGARRGARRRAVGSCATRLRLRRLCLLPMAAVASPRSPAAPIPSLISPPRCCRATR
jgi:hypothetical protein